MARKNQLSSNKDRCDICGAALDDDSLVQEFVDGSVVALCGRCAAEAGPEDLLESEDHLEHDDATAEWAGPHDDSPTAPAPPHFEAEVFAFDDLESQDRSALSEQPAPRPAVQYETAENGAAKAESELAAWASASSEHDAIREDDSDTGDDYDQEELEEATLQLVAAIAEADMEDEERLHPGADHEEAEATPLGQEAAPIQAEAAAVETEATLIEAEAVAEAVPETPAETSNEEIIDRSKDLLVPVTDLLALQDEMQSALAKLSSTLEHFMSDMAASEQKTSAVNERVQQLEDELESTRERLRTAESLLPDSAVGAAAAMAAATATKDAELLGDKPAKKPASEAAAVPPPIPPPLPVTQPTPPPLPMMPGGTGPKGGAAVSPPPLPGISAAAAGAVGAAAGAMVPPPLPGLATAAKAAASAAVTPPPLGGATAPKASAPGAESPKASATPPPSTAKPKKHLFKTSGEEVEADDDARSDGTSVDELLIAPVTPPPLSRPAKPPARPASDLVESPTPVAEAGSAQESAGEEGVDSGEALVPGPVAGAAAAMQKLLRGRKGQTQPGPESEPEPETEPEPQEVPGLAFTINEVQVAQRYFNDSEFVKKLAEISRSIGKSQANVSRSGPGAPEAAVTVFWDIVWYQYLIDLRKDLPEGNRRVILAQEGMDLEDLEPRFREKNATVNDDGRLDASELEVRLLSDPEALIADYEVATPETRLADDATEEIWDQRSAPEFRWD